MSVAVAALEGGVCKATVTMRLSAALSRRTRSRSYPQHRGAVAIARQIDLARCRVGAHLSGRNAGARQ